MCELTIRPASNADLPRLVEMGRRFRRETAYANHIQESGERMSELAADLISKEGVLISERDGQAIGMIGYVVSTHFLSGEIVAGEVFWWVEPEYRGEGIKLMLEAEKRAKERGAQRFQMIAPSEKVGKLYERLGYEYVESSFQKNL